MKNVHDAVFKLVASKPNADFDDVYDVVSELIDWGDDFTGASSELRDGIACTLIRTIGWNMRGECTRAVLVNISFSDGRPDINTNVFEW